MTTFSVGCYGKLPLHGDFIRHNAAAPELGLFDRWIQEGIVAGHHAAARQWDDLFDNSPAARFIYYCAQTQRLMPGLMIPSCDKVGRQFPFIIFTFAPLSLLGSDYPLAGALFEDFFNAAHACATDWIGQDLRTFVGRVDKLAFTLDVASRGTRFSVDFSHGRAGDLWTAMFDAPDNRRYLILHNVAEVVKPNAAPKYALRLPQAPDVRQFVFWLEATRRMGARRAPPTLAVWNNAKNQTAPCVTLLFEDLLPKYFLPLLQPAHGSDSVYQPVKVGMADDKRLAAAKQKYGRVLDNPAATVGDVLDACGRA